MANHLSHNTLDYVAREKCHDLWGKEENKRDVMGSNSLLFILAGLLLSRLYEVPINPIQLSWYLICNSKEVDNYESF